MSGADEDAVRAFLANPATHGGGVTEVAIIETHAARVFLAGTRAYKVKKHVTFPFLDFSTIAQRRHAIQRELDLNRPHAPTLYIEVVAIVRTPAGNLAFGGSADAVDYALVMNRFDQRDLLGTIAARGPLPATLCAQLADMVARYHRDCPVLLGPQSVDDLLATAASLLKELAPVTGTVGRERMDRVRRGMSENMRTARPTLLTRAASGTVRRCHGDLHLGNIVLVRGQPVAFDALEFDERLAVIDVLYDLAFLLMDLEARGDRPAANRVLNGYVAVAPLGSEIDGLGLLPLFLALRALVRSAVSAERARQAYGRERHQHTGDAARYLALADNVLSPARPVLVSVGGLSGTGKSTLAAALAPLLGRAPGAVHLRTDVERKAMFAVPQTQRLPVQAYAAEVSERVYAKLLAKAESALAGGQAVIIDSVAARRQERDAIAAIASRVGCPFAGLWLEAPFATLTSRVEARSNDASDADAAVVAAQASYDLGEMNWTRIDAGSDPSKTLHSARAALAGLRIDTTDATRRATP